MKFCKDCRYYIQSEMASSPGLAKCARDQKTVKEFAVLGTGPEFDYGWCSTNRIGRSNDDNCGVDAAWFEPIHQIEGHTA